MKIAWAYVMTAQFNTQRMTPPIAGYHPLLPPVTASNTSPAAVLNPPTRESTDRLPVASPTPVTPAMWLPTLEETLWFEAHPVRAKMGRRNRVI